MPLCTKCGALYAMFYLNLFIQDILGVAYQLILFQMAGIVPHVPTVHNAHKQQAEFIQHYILTMNV